LYAVSTAFYALLGVHFDGLGSMVGMQFIDPELLKDRLFESLWYYHASPPGLNLIAGVGLKVFGQHADWFYSACFHILGLLVAGAVYLLTWKLSASRIAAAITTGLLTFSPQFVLYENWLFYSFPSMALLTLATFALYKFAETGRQRWCVGLFALLGILLMTRSLFHPGWLVLITALLVTTMWDRRRQILLVASVPLIVVLLWCGKNYYYFGSFSMSTWLGLGLSNITTLMLPRAELQPLVERGDLSKWALVSRYDEHRAIFLADLAPPIGVPVVDYVAKSDGRVNFNYKDIPVINRYYTADSLAVMRKFPSVYLTGVVMANKLYFSPTGMNMFIDQKNLEAVAPMEQIFTPLLTGTTASTKMMPVPMFGFADRLGRPVNTSLPLMLAWIVVFAFAYTQARQAFLRPRGSQAEPRAIVMGFIVLTAGYLWLVSTTLELGENYRYRFLIEPLFFVVTATAVTAAVRAIRTASSSARASPERSQ
jgi:4-amino-4-deoxy-L-arabinose transferase-like glycosyltransferase